MVLEQQDLGMQLQVVHVVLPEPLHALEHASNRLGGTQRCIGTR